MKVKILTLLMIVTFAIWACGDDDDSPQEETNRQEQTTGSNENETSKENDTKQNEDGNSNQNTDDNGSNATDAVSILPKKIVSITVSYDEVESTPAVYEFQYDSNERLVSGFGKMAVSFEYTDNSVIVRYTDGGDIRETFLLNNGKSIKYDDGSIEYNSEGYLSKYQDEKYENSFVVVDGNMTEYAKTRNNQEREKCSFEYGDTKNNLNIDLFFVLDEDLFGSNLMDASIACVIGKRTNKLPSKIKGYYLDGEDRIEYEYEHTYEFDGDYLSKIIVTDSSTKGGHRTRTRVLQLSYK